ncbi:hypothetical protein LDR49_004296 [Salmonella enterica]|uniref:Uncharacterized protein n=1 Tax=Salmonella enterica TaxID=28901 RepID=A0A5U7LXJ4_SALER|nr:hypothetical protein [Salmonella enterica]EIE5376964.1 hypothetical protein [Salmonella enterica]EIE5433156.1 hypothetical protein [Salmonella enterica]EIE5487902.1 hypothetical protein [Salmonella enterica]EIE5943813.1 hypothetical protein [Salmonella enterica]
MRHRIFLPLLLVLSATAFSASAMAASDSKTSPGNTKSAPGGSLDISEVPDPFIQRPSWCDNWPSDQLKPLYFYQVCGFG